MVRLRTDLYVIAACFLFAGGHWVAAIIPTLFAFALFWREMQNNVNEAEEASGSPSRDEDC